MKRSKKRVGTPKNWVKRIYKYIIGMRLDGYGVIEDRAFVYGSIYLLVKNTEEGTYAIYKERDSYNYEKIDGKQILVRQRYLLDHNNWYYHTEFDVGKDGELCNVTIGTIYGKRGSRTSELA